MSEIEVTEGRLLSQDFGVGGPPTAAEAPFPPADSGKTPDILAAEIRTIKAQTGRMVLNISGANICVVYGLNQLAIPFEQSD